MANINPKAAIDDNVFRFELLKAICGLGDGLAAGAGGLTDLCSADQADVDCLFGRFDFSQLPPAQLTNITNNLDFSQLTPVQISQLSQAALNAGGSPAADAFGVVYGVIFPTP